MATGTPIPLPRKSDDEDLRVLASARLDVIVAAEHRLDDLRQTGDLLPDTLDARLLERALDLRQLEREHSERSDLRRERLGGRDTDLRTRVRVDHAVALARDPAADDVGDRERLRAVRGEPRAHPRACRRSRPTA